MSTIVTRAGKGSPLTNNEVDANFVNLNTDKIESITSVDGSVVISATGTTRDLSVGTALNTATLISQVRNETGATLTKGTVVYISGAGGNKALVSKALASGDATSAQTYGVIQADISNNQNGYVVVVGEVSGLNTIAYPDGTQLYLSGTTAGTYTSTKPYAPIHLVYVGIVTYSHATQGTIQVKIQNGYEMDELHNVSAQSPSNGNTLVYNTSNSLWESTSTLSGSYTLSAGTANGVTYLNGSKVLTSGSALTFDGTNLGVTGKIDVNGTGTSTFTSTATSPVQINGTSIPTLTIRNSTTSVETQVRSTTSEGLIRTATNHPLVFGVNAVEGMRLTSTGLGIGTSSPSSKLDVSGVISLQGTTLPSAGTARIFSRSSDSSTYIQNATGGDFYLLDGSQNTMYAARSTSHQWAISNVTKLTLDSSGNLGLGVTPSAWTSSVGTRALQLPDGNLWSFTGGVAVGNNYYYGSGGNRYYINSAAATEYYQTAGTHVWRTAASGTAGNAISFTQAMTLDASGNLVIGATSGNGRLSVRDSSAALAEIRTTAGTNYAALEVVNTAGSIYIGKDNSTGSFFGSGTAYAAAVYSSGAYPMVFYTNGTERARIDSSGNLGLGVTPSAWFASKALQISGVGAFYADGVSYNYTTGVANNAYQTGASSWAYRVAATAAARYEQTANIHNWFISSGTPSAGGTISFTQAMTLDADGDLGIGITSPSFRLHAVSSAAVVSRIGSSGGSGAFINFIDSGASPSVAPSVGAIGNSLVFMGDGSALERARITPAGVFQAGTIQASGTAVGSFSASKWFIQSEDSVTTRAYFTGSNSSTYGSWEIYNATSTGSPLLTAAFTADYTRFGRPGTSSEAMRISSAGSVGIGTDNPNAKLSVVSSGDVANFSASGAVVAVRVDQTSANPVIIRATNNSSNFWDTQVNVDNSISWDYNDSEKMRITSAGNVGIGTNNPAAKLSVNTTSFTAASNNAQVAIENTEAWSQGLAFYIWGAGTYNEGYASGYIGAPNTSSAIYLSGGARVVDSLGAGGWAKTLRSTSASFIAVGNGETIFYGNSGLTQNTVYSPTERMKIDSAGNVGIGTGTPQTTLDVRSYTNNSTTIDNGVTLWNPSGVDNTPIGIRFSTYGDETGNQSPKQFIGAIRDGAYGAGKGSIVFCNRDAVDASVVTLADERMRITSSGYVTKPYQPMFSVWKSDGNVSGSNPGTVVVFNGVIVNQSSSYSNSTGRFTAPVSGTYYFSFSGMLNSTNAAADLQIIIDKNGASQSISNPGNSAGTIQGMGFACSAVISLSAGDYVHIRFYASNGAGASFYAAGGVFNNFSGFLIG